MTAVAVIAYIYSLLAILLISIKARELVAIFKKGQPDPTRSSQRGARWRNLLKEVLGHTKMTRFTGTGIAHWFVMVGFFLIGLCDWHGFRPGYQYGARTGP